MGKRAIGFDSDGTFSHCTQDIIIYKQYIIIILRARCFNYFFYLVSSSKLGHLLNRWIVRHEYMYTYLIVRLFICECSLISCHFSLSILRENWHFLEIALNASFAQRILRNLWFFFFFFVFINMTLFCIFIITFHLITEKIAHFYCIPFGCCIREHEQCYNVGVTGAFKKSIQQFLRKALQEEFECEVFLSLFLLTVGKLKKILFLFWQLRWSVIVIWICYSVFFFLLCGYDEHKLPSPNCGIRKAIYSISFKNSFSFQLVRAPTLHHFIQNLKNVYHSEVG